LTLILGMSKSEGIYMSVDYRITPTKKGAKPLPDAVKFLTVHYPGGPKALFVYTGDVAILPGGKAFGDWLRETLRDDAVEFNSSMKHLGRQLEREIAPLRWSLIVNMLVIDGDLRYFAGFSNMKPKGFVTRSFDRKVEKLTEPFVFGNGAPARRVIADERAALLSEQLSVHPRDPREHMKLLAAVNRRVAKKSSTVSPYCHVSFINADDRYGPPRSEAFLEHGEVAPVDMPEVVMGFDLTYIKDQLRRRGTEGRQ
jgi:hypothetical protein